MIKTFSSPPMAWRQALTAFAMVVVAFAFLYGGTGAAMIGIWARSDTFAHGFVVLPIALWLVWRRRHLLSGYAPKPSATAGVLLALAGVAWLLGELAAVNALSQFAMVAMLVLLVPTLLGYSLAGAIAFPLAFLFFSVPFGEFALPQLMQWTADFTVLALRASGIPVYREGLQFIIPSGSWSVIEACSGIRYIIASLAVGTLFAYLNYQTMQRRVMFILVSMLVPVLANWLRAYMIVMLGHLSGNTIATGVDHIIYGWVFFGLVIMLMFWIGARWSEPEPDLSKAAPSSVSPAGSGASTKAWLLASAVIVGVLALPHAMLWQIHRTMDGQPQPNLVAPAQLSSGWVASPETDPKWKPAFQSPSAQLTTGYARGDHAVKLYIAYYRNQSAKRKLVTSDNVLVKSQDGAWAQVLSGNRSLPLSDGEFKVRTAELRVSAAPSQLGPERLTVWQYYWINGTLTTSDMLAKIYTALYSLTGQGDDSAVVIAYAPKGDSGQGESALEAFMQANAAAIGSWLQSIQHPTQP
jgi:exosortase A